MSITFKRGDTFALSGAVLDNGVAVDCTGWVARVQIRQAAELIAEPVLTWVSQALGTYSVRVDDTTTWPVATLVFDIEYTLDTGQIVSTATGTILVIQDVTL